MKLNTKQIRQFFALSSGITTNSIIPILSYIKLEGSALTKTNLRTYVVHKIDAPAEESLLLDEKILSDFVKRSVADEIEVLPEGKIILLKEGKRVMKCPTAAIKDFPKLPDATKEDAVEFDADTLSAIGVAAKNVGHTGLNEQLDFVHLIDGYIVASDRTKFYCRQSKGVPNLVLDTECANTISQFQSAIYYSRGRYNFFEIGDTLYGFIRSEVKTPNLMPFIPKVQPEAFIEFKTADFISFCDTFMSTSGAKDLPALWRGNVLSFYDPELDLNYSAEIETEGTFEPDVNFIPRHFGAYFKSLGISSVRICDSELKNSSLSVWDIDDIFFSGLIVGTAK